MNELNYCHSIRRTPIIIFIQWLLIEVTILTAFFVLQKLSRWLGIETIMELPVEWGLFFVLQLLALSIMFWIIIYWFTEKYVILPKQISVKKGIFIIRRDVYKVSNIETIKMRQDILGLIFGYGSLHMYAPTLNEQIHLRDIHQPKKFMRIIESSIIKANNSRIMIGAKD